MINKLFGKQFTNDYHSLIWSQTCSQKWTSLVVYVYDFLDTLLLGFFFEIHKIVSPSSELSVYFIGISLKAVHIFYILTRIYIYVTRYNYLHQCHQLQAGGSSPG